MSNKIVPADLIRFFDEVSTAKLGEWIESPLLQYFPNLDLFFSMYEWYHANISTVFFTEMDGFILKFKPNRCSCWYVENQWGIEAESDLKFINDLTKFINQINDLCRE